MEIKLTARNIALDENIKSYVYKRLEKVEHIYKRIFKCEVILEAEKQRKNVEIILSLRRNRIIAKESSPDIYASIDNAVDNVKKQIRRVRDRFNSKGRRSVFRRIIAPVGRVSLFNRRGYPIIIEEEMINAEVDSNENEVT